MSPHWLERLNEATEYRELQAVFSEMAAAARSAEQGAEAAASIDEAIYRIQQESLQDEKQLDEAREDYQSFKKQQRGFVGWLKRHLPFTETRRREKRHTQAVSDQEAEVLADNLIIARAQMIKEQLLPPDSRRLGREPADWQRQLTGNTASSSIAEYAAIVRELDEELQQSRAFIDDIESDINAFAKARFSDSEDRQRRDADLSAARNELAALEAEIQSEVSLRAGAIGRLGEMVSEDLDRQDPAYRELKERARLLETAHRRAKDARKLFQDLHGEAKEMREKAARLDGMPEERGELSDRQRRVQRDEADAQQRRNEASSNLGRLAAGFDDSNDLVERARAAVTAAERVYRAHLAEIGQAEANPDDSSPVAAEYAHTKTELEAAEAGLKIAAGPYNAAKAEVELAEQTTQDLQRRQEELRKKQAELEDRERQLRSDVDSQRLLLRKALDRARPTIEDYLAARAANRLPDRLHGPRVAGVPSSLRSAPVGAPI